MLSSELEQAIIEKSKLVEIDLEIADREEYIQEFKDCHALHRAEIEAENARNSVATLEREIDTAEKRNAQSVDRAERQIREGLKARKETLPLIKKTAQKVKCNLFVRFEIQSSSSIRDSFILTIFAKVSYSGKNFVFLFYLFWQKSLLVEKKSR